MKGMFLLQSTYYPPTYEENAFNCPHCQVYANQEWRGLFVQGADSLLRGLKSAKCSHCFKRSYWYNELLIIPENTVVAPPHVDMPELIKEDYLEAASIVTKSPRGAASLLRLCLQKLMSELGEEGHNINNDIASLVKKGLPVEVQQALDTLRVIGNNAVHPGELDLTADIETALALFELINFIIDEQITKKKRIVSLFNKLPSKAKNAIEKRDAK